MSEMTVETINNGRGCVCFVSAYIAGLTKQREKGTSEMTVEAFRCFGQGPFAVWLVVYFVWVGVSGKVEEGR